MGGRALLQYGIETERKTTEEFRIIGSQIKTKVILDLGAEATVVKCYRSKETHGDLDLLIKVDRALHERGINLKEYVKDTFKPNAINNNNGVISFDYHNFQVDLIPMKESNWEIAQVYFSYDPLGNAMGKTFHKLNLSYGWDGLKYKYRNFNGRNSHDITISKDPRKIFEFGGFDYDRYLKGFDNIEEIFDFIISGKYFNIDIFRMENLNHIDRKRNRKRKSYHEFLNYVEEKNINKFYSFFSDKSLYLQIINQEFPEAKIFDKLAELDKKNEVNKQLHDKFNGNLVREWVTTLEGKELGHAIYNFQMYLGENWKEVLLEMTPEQVRKKFLEFYVEKK